MPPWTCSGGRSRPRSKEPEIMKLIVSVLATLVLGALSQPAVAQSSRLDVVKSRGVLRCGVNPNFPGFALPDAAGQWRGFDVDMCRAVATAVFGDAGKAQYLP